MTTAKIYKDYTVTIEPEEYPTNPRDCDNLGTMSCSHSRYILGDEQIDDAIDWLQSMIDMSEESLERLAYKHKVPIYSETILDLLYDRMDEDYIIMSLYLYDHSGITMSTTPFACGFDSGRVGFIWISLEQVRQDYGVQRISKKLRAKVIDILKSEVETYDMYLRGDVYRYTFTDPSGSELDSCGGFYGDDLKTNGMSDYYEAAIDNNIEQRSC